MLLAHLFHVMNPPAHTVATQTVVSCNDPPVHTVVSRDDHTVAAHTVAT